MEEMAAGDGHDEEGYGRAPPPVGTFLMSSATSSSPDALNARQLLLAMATAFLLMCGYSLVKPIRDEVAAAHPDAISALWTGTFFATLVAVPLFGFLASRCTRRRLLQICFRSFLCLFLLFSFLFHQQDPATRPFALDAGFYIWVSVYNLFTLSLFWSVLADLFRANQGKHSFARVTMGASLGAIAGPALTSVLIGTFGSAKLLLLSAVILEVGLQLLLRLSRGQEPAKAETAQPSFGGQAWDGLKLVVRSPQLRRICGYLLLMVLTSGFLYRLKAELAHELGDRAARTSFYARIELIANSVTLALQAFASGWLMQRRGVGVTLMVLPIIAVLCFGFLGLWLTLTTVAVVDILRRTGQYAMAKPAREVLFTVLPREEKYKAKSFVDTFVYRGGDLAVSWLYDLLAGIGLHAQALAFFVVPTSLLWAGTARKLGRQHQLLEEQHDK